MPKTTSAASGVALEARDLAQEAIRRIEVIETRMEERQRAETERHEETRRLIIDLKTSFGENFLALQNKFTDSLEKGLADLVKALRAHANEDDARFGSINRRSWAAMWSLVAVLMSMIGSLIFAIWKLTGH